MAGEDREYYKKDRFAYESIWRDNQQSNKTKEVEPSETINKLI